MFCTILVYIYTWHLSSLWYFLFLKYYQNVYFSIKFGNDMYLLQVPTHFGCWILYWQCPCQLMQKINRLMFYYTSCWGSSTKMFILFLRFFLKHNIIFSIIDYFSYVSCILVFYLWLFLKFPSLLYPIQYTLINNTIYPCNF